MSRTALLLAVLLAAPAVVATSPAAANRGDTVEIRSGSLLGFAFVADLGGSNEAVGVGRCAEDRALAGVSWRHDGWKVTALAGFFSYAYTGASEGTARAVSFAAGHETALLGGMLSVELRQTILWENQSRLDITQARMGWSLKF